MSNRRLSTVLHPLQRRVAEAKKGNAIHFLHAHLAEKHLRGVRDDLYVDHPFLTFNKDVAEGLVATIGLCNEYGLLYYLQPKHAEDHRPSRECRDRQICFLCF